MPNLPPDPDDMNARRADWARTALSCFMIATNQKCQKEALGDLIVDLLHLSDELGMSPLNTLRNAESDYIEETSAY